MFMDFSILKFVYLFRKYNLKKVTEKKILFIYYYHLKFSKLDLYSPTKVGLNTTHSSGAERPTVDVIVFGWSLVRIRLVGYVK